MRVWFYVAINDNDREIGERRYEPTTHNAAVNLEPGFHRITAEFNGIVLIQEVTLAVNEVKTLIFTFERATFDFRTYLDSIGTVSRSASGYLSYPPSPYDSWNIFSLDTGTTYPFMEQGLAIHIFDRQPISLSTTGYAEMSISSSGIKHRVWAETTVTGGSKPHPYYTIGMNASFTWWNPGSMPIYRDRTHGLETNAFRWWFIQNKAILGFVPPEQRSHFEVSGNEIIDYNFDRVVWFDANAERELKIWSKSPCFYVDGYGTAIYQESVPTSFYFSKVYLVSIPYDLSDMAN
jgi:hypothetical protein